jgi:hypothetical protein
VPTALQLNPTQRSGMPDTSTHTANASMASNDVPDDRLTDRPSFSFALLFVPQEKQQAAEEEAKRLASLPLPPGWETAESRSTGQTYYVNTQTGATQYEFPDGAAEVWKVYGASHTYGSKGIRDKPTRRKSL